MISDLRKFLNALDTCSLLTTSKDKKYLSIEIVIINKHIDKIKTYDQLKDLIYLFLRRYFLPKLQHRSFISPTSSIPFLARYLLDCNYQLPSKFAFEKTLPIIDAIRKIQTEYTNINIKYQKIINILYNDSVNVLSDINIIKKIIDSYYIYIKSILYPFVIEPLMNRYEFILPTIEDNDTIDNIRNLLMQDIEIRKYYLSPKEACEAAALRAATLLKKYRCTIAEIAIWTCVNTDFNIPTNHYILLARNQISNDATTTYAIDITYSQPNKYEIKYQIVDTLNNWLFKFQNKLDKRPRTLVKYRDIGSISMADSKFSNHGISDPFIISLSEILSSSIWYTKKNLPSYSKYLLEKDISNLNNCWQSTISHKLSGDTIIAPPCRQHYCPTTHKKIYT